MDFERSLFGKMQLWIVDIFFLHKKVPLLMNHNIWKNPMLWFITTGKYLFVKKNVFNYSELHFSEVTSYKIHTLTSRFWFFFDFLRIFNCFKALAMKMRTGVLKRTYLFLLLAFVTSFLWPYEKINFKLVSVCAIVHTTYVLCSYI